MSEKLSKTSERESLFLKAAVLATLASVALAGLDETGTLRKEVTTSATNVTVGSGPAYEKLKNSSLVLITRKTSEKSWEPVCSANKIAVGSKNYIQTAGHCIDYEKFANNPLGKDVQTIRMYDQRKNTNQYAIAMPHNQADRPFRPIARINAFAGYVTDQDIDLVLGSTTEESYRYKAVKSLPSEQVTTANKDPKSGQIVAMHSSPAGSMDRSIAVSGIGTYLGRFLTNEYVGSSNIKKQVTQDYVAINDSNYDQISCTPGSSGSSVILENGTILGPASTISITSKHFDQDTRDLRDFPSAYSDDNLENIEELTGINMDTTKAVCSYATPMEGGYRALAETLTP